MYHMDKITRDNDNNVDTWFNFEAIHISFELSGNYNYERASINQISMHINTN